MRFLHDFAAANCYSMPDNKGSAYRVVDCVLTGAVSKVLSKFKKPATSGRRRNAVPLEEQFSSGEEDQKQPPDPKSQR